MSQISFDGHACGIPATDNHCADVSGPGAANCVPPMVRRKFIGQTAQKVVRLADIYRIPKTIGALTAKDVDAADSIEDGTNRVVLEFVRRTAKALPK